MKVKPTKNRGEVVLKLNRRDEPLLAAASRGAATSPFQIKNILVATDFSECAKKALQYAIPLAKEHEAAITLLYVLPTPSYAGEYSGIDCASLEAEMRTKGAKQLSALAADEVCDKVPVETVVRTGSPAEEIIEAAKSQPTDLIVISTHGRTGLKHVFLGSVAEHVVQRAPCPVLVVREREHEFLAR